MINFSLCVILEQKLRLSFGLRAVLFQKVGEVCKPVVYAPRELSETMPKYKKKPWLKFGLVRNSEIIYWGASSNLKQTTNL